MNAGATGRRIGVALTAVVGVALTWSMYTVISGAPGCEASAAECPASFGPGLGVLLASVVLSFVAMALGAVECFAVLFIAIGAGALLAVPGADPGDRGFPLSFGSAFFLAGVGAAWFLSSLGTSGEVAVDLVTRGRPAIGRILDVTDTGVTLDDDPRVLLTVEITPADEVTDSHTATKVVTMDRVRPILIGDRYPVLVDPEDPTVWGIVTAINDAALVSQDVRILWEQLRGPLPPPRSTV